MRGIRLASIGPIRGKPACVQGRVFERFYRNQPMIRTDTHDRHCYWPPVRVSMPSLQGGGIKLGAAYSGGQARNRHYLLASQSDA
jgi:hypothetical protein